MPPKKYEQAERVCLAIEAERKTAIAALAKKMTLQQNRTVSVTELFLVSIQEKYGSIIDQIIAEQATK